MKDFITLEEFLLLRDDSDFEPKRSLGHLTHGSFFNDGWDLGHEIVQRYKLARLNWEKYGEAGPERGSNVITLVSGHGGGVGVIRRFDGIYLNDPRFFALTRVSGEDHLRTSMLSVATWWAGISSLEFLDQRGFNYKIKESFK